MKLVTGGTGFLGAHLLLALAKNEKKLKAIKRPNSNLSHIENVFKYFVDDWQKEFNKIEWLDVDILDYEGLQDAFVGVKSVFHCAAIVSFHKRDRENMYRTNVDGTANCIEAAIHNNVEYFCHVSSVAALSKNHHNSAINEEFHYLPGESMSDYGRSKLQSELIVWKAMEGGLNASIVNPSVILGPWNPNFGASKMFRKIAKGLKFYTPGVTGYVDVNDVVNIMLNLENKKVTDQRFLLNGENLSYQNMLALIAETLQVKRPQIRANRLMLSLALYLDRIISFITLKPSQLSHEIIEASLRESLFSNRKIKELLSYEFKAISESVALTADYLVKQHKII